MRRGVLFIVLAGSLLTASCLSTQYTSAGNDCRGAPDPTACMRERREAVEASEAQRIRYEREHRAIDRPRTDLPPSQASNSSNEPLRVSRR
jgi:hypothetical protein